MTKLLDGSGRERLTEGFRKSADARKGFTLLELIVAATILMILTMMALPMARLTIQREKERQLRRALWQMRDAIDCYKEQSDRGAFQRPKQSES